MAHGDLSQRIRDRAVQRYVRPAKLRKQRKFKVVIRDLMNELEAEGFPKNHPRQFCTAVQTRNFLDEHGLTIERVEGPPGGNGPSVIVHYAINGEDETSDSSIAVVETPAERAFRVTEKLRGALKDVIASHGGTRGYISWVRGYEDEE